MLTTVEELRQRILVQSGMAGDDLSEDEWDAFVLEAEKADRKVYWGRGADFGARVVVVWDDGYKDEGYLTTLPGFDQEDMEGVVHIPHTQGEKCDAGPVWLTIHDLAALPMVAKVLIGHVPARRTDTEGGEDE